METSSSEDDTHVGGITGGDGGVKAGNHGDKDPSLPEVLFSIGTLSCVEVCVLVVYISCNVDQGMSWYIWLSVGICCVVSEEISLSFNFRAPFKWL